MSTCHLNIFFMIKWGVQKVNPKGNQSWIFHWKDWCWSWNSNTLVTWCKEWTHWKRPWCWERLKAGGEGDDRGWDGWMASPIWWTWVCVSSGSWWWTGKTGVLQSVGSQRDGHDWATELKQSACFVCRSTVIVLSGSTCTGACVWARLFYFFPHEIPFGLERVTDKLWVLRPKYWALNQKWVRWKCHFRDNNSIFATNNIYIFMWKLENNRKQWLHYKFDSVSALKYFLDEMVVFLITMILYTTSALFLPGESRGQGSLVGCRLQGRTESDTTEAT